MAEATLVVGAMWGDEGKGKIVDVLSSTVSLCLRGQGGHNAGHTIVTGGVTYDFHLLPSGLVNPNCLNLVGSGCVVHVPSFFKELEQLKEKGLNTEGRILLSDRAHVDFDLFQAVDGLEEVELGKDSIGTTKKGLQASNSRSPTFSCKAARSGLMLAEIFEYEVLEAKLRRLADGYKKRFGDLLKYDVEDELARFREYIPKLGPYIVEEIPLLRSAKENKAQILIEGAQATMLDITYGTYPYVTSSNCSVGGILAGLPLDWRSIKEVIGVMKVGLLLAYTTRVGSGPFPTEQLNEVGEKLQQVGREIGVTTGRKRRCGWLDLVVIKHTHEVNGYTALNLTKLDILDDFDELKVATEYWFQGEKLESLPANCRTLDSVEVKYETLPGWKQSTFGKRAWYDLPPNARKYVEFIENFTGIPVKYVGTGPDRDHMIYRQGARAPQ
ncbi:adenylosuccinate synthetase-like protein [Trichodelitschia bisporula]|uniref:Adenylosuccinate synthetase n=1 Tax=Trichodelitschia bisporula TaxID=703511 RepID=A0A6G1I637_9PEZI|nr:adenylosuccinate synthetase-like protein [Trichodelitschia bisporula]